MPGYFTNAVTLDQVRAAKPGIIYYAVATCWWTHDPTHLCRHRTTGLPCDPRGSMLLQTAEGRLGLFRGEAEKFLQSAEANVAHYGKHGLRAFMAAHNQNCVVSEYDRRSTSFERWDDYNRLLDEFDANRGAR